MHWKNLLFLLIIPYTLQGQLVGDLGALMNDPSVTQHSIVVDGETLDYTVTAGYMLMDDEMDSLQAKVFFIAYTLDDVEDATERPITYTFNGGPGSSSVWLHMGGLGPKRVRMRDDGGSLPPPYDVVDNPQTWLDKTDLVFIDPMMTGYSRPAAGVDKRNFLGYEEDIRLVGDFIRSHCNLADRWNSPKYVAGESYGTTRAAGLSGYLQDRYGMYLNGVVLISAVLDFGTIRDYLGNDMAPLLRLPTFAATSWYHGKAAERYNDLPTFLEEVESFTLNEYALALIKGDLLSEEERSEIIDRLHDYTGLSKAYIEDTNLRLFVGEYNKELLREQGKTVGRLDGRFTGVDYDDRSDSYEFDPSYDKTIYGSFTAALHQHFSENLEVDIQLPYEILTGRARPWNYSNVQNQFLNVAETLRGAMTRNPYLKVFVANGYYDLATPYFATEYVFNHMNLRDGLDENVTMAYYEAGHMMYIRQESLIKLKQDIAAFYEE